MSAPDRLPTQAEVYAHALEQLRTARTALSDARDWLASDTDDRLTGATRPPAVGEQRRAARVAIGGAKDEIDTAQGALAAALAACAPTEERYVPDDPAAEIADEPNRR